MAKARPFQPLGGILEGLLQEWGRQKDLMLWRLAEHWESVVGPQIALHTAPQTIRFHTMTIAVDSAPWMHQLLFFKKEMIEKTNLFLKKPLIQDIYFKMMVFPTPRLGLKTQKRASGKNAADQPTKPVPEQVVALSKGIDTVRDDALQKTIHEALARYFQE
jgi:predicted nucleic acid-binding Zn ribbon protein